MSQDENRDFPVYVLANGCTDSTESIVEQFALQHPTLELVSLAVADKASAWNHYVHHLAPQRDIHFFVDGDVEICDEGCSRLQESLAAAPEAVAAGGLPASGRTRVAWSDSMLRMGRLAGGFYALRGDFFNQIRGAEVIIPVGLVGDDLLVTCLAKGWLHAGGLNRPSQRVRLSADALFRFDSMSRRNPGHWPMYLKRLVRYQLREHQLRMLFYYLRGKSVEDIPADVLDLYPQVEQLARYRWRGWLTPFDLVAIWKIRRALGKWI